MTLKITITDAGRAELIQNSHLGFNAVTIVALDLGDAQYVPDRAQTALGNKVARLESIAGTAVGDGILHVTARDESAAAYNVGEFGLITDKGTLFAVCALPASAGWIIQKAAPSILLLATDVLLEEIDAEQIRFGDVVFLNPPATPAMAGVVELADDTEAADGTDNRRALTPRGARKFLDADITKEPAIQAGIAAQFWRGDKTWADFAATVRGAVLTGLSTATATAVAATDTLLVALGKLQAQVTSLGNSKLDKTATAAAATKLATARSINGVPFDGTANITVADATKEPVIAAGTTAQFWRGDKTWADLATAVRGAVLTGLSTATATAVAATDTLLVALGKLQAQVTSLGSNKLDKTATATAATKLATPRTINGVAFDGSANISISAPANGGTSSACSGNAATATKLQTARTINGVAFDGSANITVADATKEPVIAAGTTAQFWRGDKTWADLATAVRGAVLAGLSTASATAVAATDTLLVAVGKLQAQVTSLGNSKLDKTATAAAATKLATARTINGVAFDGSANISVSAPANGGTSAACSGNSATATKLATARKINGINFDGTADITLPASAQGYTQLFSGNGWCKLPNGWILQWGTADPAYNGNIHHDLNVTLPTTFPGAILACGASLRTGFTWDGALGHTGAAPLSTSQIRIRSAGATTARPGVQWWAIGH